MRNFLVFALLLWRAAVCAPLTITDLGGFGGADSTAYRVNASGAVVGWASTLADETNATLFSGSTPLSFGQGSAYGINNLGTTVGVSIVNGAIHGTVWNSQGRATDLGQDVSAMAINDQGTIAGSDGHAIVISGGQTQDLGTALGGGWSAAYDVNNAGAVAGYGLTATGASRGFVWTPTTAMRVLGTFGGASSQAFAINNRGDVVGSAALSSGYQHAFLDSNGVMQDLGTLGGGNSYAYGVNDEDQVVGYSALANGDETHAFLYRNGVTIDLNSVLPANSGWDLLAGYGINNGGVIVGSGIFQGRSAAFELTLASHFGLAPSVNLSGVPAPAPVPEPRTFALLAAALVILCAFRTRRRC